jgi:signal recognition particle subunit SRP19
MINYMKKYTDIMKDYDHQIIWLDYFNKNLSRKKGRKVEKNISVYDPTMQELIGASKSLELDLSEENINNPARYPRRSFVKSGYIMISKKEKKSTVVNQIAKKMVETRQQRHQ